MLTLVYYVKIDMNEMISKPGEVKQHEKTPPPKCSIAIRHIASPAQQAVLGIGSELHMSVPVVRVGVGVIVRSFAHPGCVLVGKRKGSTGAGLLALPGGHLEMNETYQNCGVREIKEETNLDIADIQFVHLTQDIAIGGNPDKHYITIFVSGVISAGSDPLTLMEPDKCEGWEFKEWSSIMNLYHENPGVLFDPLRNFIRDGKSAL